MSDKIDFANDSDKVDMSGFGEDEIAEAKMDWADIADSEDAKKESEDREIRDKEEKKRDEDREKRDKEEKKTGEEGKDDRRRDDRKTISKKPNGGRSNRRQSNPSAYITGFPISYKEPDVRKFITSGIKDPIEADKIDHIKYFVSSGKTRCIISFKDPESLKKILNAEKTVVEGNEIHVEEYRGQGRGAAGGFP